MTELHDPDPFSSTGTDRAAVDALLAATHGDPFAVLGPHAGPGGRRVDSIIYKGGDAATSARRG